MHGSSTGGKKDINGIANVDQVWIIIGTQQVQPCWSYSLNIRDWYKLIYFYICHILYHDQSYINHISQTFYVFSLGGKLLLDFEPSPSYHFPKEWVMASATVVTARMNGNTPRSVEMFVQSRGEQERHARGTCQGGMGFGWSWALDGHLEAIVGYTLWWTNSLQLKMAIEIVDFPIKNGGSFHSKMLVHQRVVIT